MDFERARCDAGVPRWRDRRHYVSDRYTHVLAISIGASTSPKT